MKIIKKSRSSSRVFENEYFVGKGSKDEPKKQKKTKRPVEVWKIALKTKLQYNILLFFPII